MFGYSLRNNASPIYSVPNGCRYIGVHPLLFNGNATASYPLVGTTASVIYDIFTHTSHFRLRT